MNKSLQSFGGDWTERKLEDVRKYLCAYTLILKNTRYKFAYIDAFAGTGYRVLPREQADLLPEFQTDESQEFLNGSARIALRVEPPFSQYIFVEKNRKRFAELKKLKDDFPERAARIKLVNMDANPYLIDLCKRNWSKHRAIVFLDPFGMAVEWRTIEAMGLTKAIDLWLLFPIGVAVNRLLPKSGDIPDAWQHRLDIFLGATNWRSEFYKTSAGLFDEFVPMDKTANIDSIGRYFINRLKTVFTSVAPNPRLLVSASNSPLFLLCFASSNKGPALKIAQDILGK
jgi:three-Cys-motif partner protein